MELTAEREPVVTAPTRYKMTTDIPAGIIAPDAVDAAGHVALLRWLA